MGFLDYEGLRYFYGKVLARIKAITASDVGAVPIDGSKSITGQWLDMYNNRGSFNVGDGSFNIIIKNEDLKESRYITVNSPENRPNISDAFVLYETVDSASIPYKIFGEHNPPNANQVGAIAIDATINGYFNSNIDELEDGVYFYNGWTTLTCTAGLPFTNKIGIWIKKQQGDTVANRLDTVISEDGEIYTMHGYDGNWINDPSQSVSTSEVTPTRNNQITWTCG